MSEPAHVHTLGFSDTHCSTCGYVYPTAREIQEENTRLRAELDALRAVIEDTLISREDAIGALEAIRSTDIWRGSLWEDIGLAVDGLRTLPAPTYDSTNGATSS